MKKYQVFISSTYIDLKEERAQLIKATLEVGHIPVGMEMFNAADEEQWETIKRTIDSCDYYALIIAHRYGSIDEKSKKKLSFTEKEYDYASSIGVPVIAFVLEKGAAWSAEHIDTDEATVKKLNAFKTKAKKKMVDFWTNKDNLHAKFITAFSKVQVSKPRNGWIPASEGTDPKLANEIARLSSENAELRQKIINLDQVVFMPSFSLSFWIEWRVGLHAGQSSYYLVAEVKNIGNLVAQSLKIKVHIPNWVLTDTDSPSHMEGYQEREITLSNGRGTLAHPLLPGDTKVVHYKIMPQAVAFSHGGSIYYTIHPEQGIVREGQITFSDIEVRSFAPPRP